MAQLTEILAQHYHVNAEALSAAERIRAEKGGNLGEILVQQKALTEQQLLEALSTQFDIPYWPKLPLNDIDTGLVAKIPIQFLKKYCLVPINCRKPPTAADCGLKAPSRAAPGQPICAAGCVIAVRDPLEFQALDDLVRILNIADYQLVLSARDTILSAINLQYDLRRDSAEQLVQDMEEDGTTIISEIEETADLLDDTSEAPIIKLVNHIISQSIKARASDIHFEPYQNSFTVRYRVDGILYDLLTPPKWIQPALISRVKVMAKMNIAEKRLPQDGRFDVRVGDQDIDVRVSTIPTSFGERLVLRLLNKSGSLLELTDLGLSPQRLELLQRLVVSPNGIILVTGPTGSGKTTTLYAILQSINKP